MGFRNHGLLFRAGGRKTALLHQGGHGVASAMSSAIWRHTGARSLALVVRMVSGHLLPPPLPPFRKLSTGRAWCIVDLGTACLRPLAPCTAGKPGAGNHPLGGRGQVDVPYVVLHGCQVRGRPSLSVDALPIGYIRGHSSQLRGILGLSLSLEISIRA